MTVRTLLYPRQLLNVSWHVSISLVMDSGGAEKNVEASRNVADGIIKCEDGVWFSALDVNGCLLKFVRFCLHDRLSYTDRILKLMGCIYWVASS